MKDSPGSTPTTTQPEPESVRRLLAALGEWGVAEVQGAPEMTLEQLAERAKDAYQDVAAVA